MKRVTFHRVRRCVYRATPAFLALTVSGSESILSFLALLNDCV